VATLGGTPISGEEVGARGKISVGGARGSEDSAAKTPVGGGEKWQNKQGGGGGKAHLHKKQQKRKRAPVGTYNGFW